ncbi:MAG: AraC family transcriptional regulator [Pseudonocardia sp.]|nr:MAG: AraC family transcriptional regulator [Pseudonocardia sp.]
MGREERIVTIADAGEAEKIGSALFYPQRLTVLDRGRDFSMHFETFELNSLTFGILSCSRDISIDCAELQTSYHVNIPLTGAIESQIGSATTIATPHLASLYMPTGDTILRRWHSSSQVLALKIDRRALESELTSLLGRPCSTPVDLAGALDVSHGIGASWLSLIRDLQRHLLRDTAEGLTKYPVMAAHLESAAITGLLLSSNHRFRDELEKPSSKLRPRSVKLVIEAIESDAGKPYTSKEMAMIAGCSYRRLQESFKDFAGMTPMEYLREVRLDTARRVLAESDPSTTSVAEVAYSLGFSNLGRFSSSYFAKFGVKPSATLHGD